MNEFTPSQDTLDFLGLTAEQWQDVRDQLEVPDRGFTRPQILESQIMRDSEGFYVRQLIKINSLTPLPLPEFEGEFTDSLTIYYNDGQEWKVFRTLTTKTATFIPRGTYIFEVRP